MVIFIAVSATEVAKIPYTQNGELVAFTTKEACQKAHLKHSPEVALNLKLTGKQGGCICLQDPELESMYKEHTFFWNKENYNLEV